MIHVVPLTSLRRNAQAALRIEQLAIWLATIQDGFPPILINDENEVLLGESRVAAAQASGLGGIPAIRVSQLDEQQQRKFVLRERLLAVKHVGSSAGLHVELSQLALKFPQLREAIAHPDDAGLKAHLLLQSLGINDFGAGATTETTARQKSDNADYEVGFGKPPANTRFQKGQSGNPKGRPAGRISLKQLIAEESCRVVQYRDESGDVEEMPAIQAAIRSQFNSAAKGKSAAQKAVISTVEQLEAEWDKADVPNQATNLERARRIAFALTKAARMLPPDGGVGSFGQ